MSKVFWTRNALGQLSAIYEYISRDSERYAKRMVDRITNRSKQIETFPLSGQVVVEYKDPNIREVIEGQYRIIYRNEPKRIAVLGVIHGARLLPADLPSTDT